MQSTLAPTTAVNRLDTALANQTNTKKEITSATKLPLSGHLETLKATVKGLGMDEDSLAEIICLKTNQELQEMNSLQGNTDLEKDTISNTSGDFYKLTVVLAMGRRTDEGSVIDCELTDKMPGISVMLEQRGKGQISILTKQSGRHLQKVFDKYKSYSLYGMEQSTRKRSMYQEQAPAFCLLTSKSKAPCPKVLIRIMVSHSEAADMLTIKNINKNYSKSLYTYIPLLHPV
ncbi:LOW QUALITY PROTEIN: Annexin A2 [Galemys pyrenaicus]|uniref:Annexin A2 n=1 Tax=Galemys pyrenaicus TaxID=202257 RepID=A0A8J6DL86_GALPY|nr:LOW QUALITY PROTEIN: Annexin A2 [Galemys pyrenaicus]